MNAPGSHRRLLAVVVTLACGPGAGHCVRGRIARGAVWLALTWLMVPLAISVGPWLLLILPAAVLAACVDAGVVATPARGVPATGRAVLLVLGALALSLATGASVKAFYIEAFKIPAGSMMPTLEVGDHLWVRKGRFQQRGDVVVFAYPGDESKDFIKRIVARGGDVIVLRGNAIVLNGRPVPRRRQPGSCSYPDIEEGSERVELRPCVAYEEELDGKTYRVIQDEQSMSSDRKPVTVPEGHVYVLGDNRDNSHDSRFWGTVPVKNLKGRAASIFWSSDHGGDVRWSRLGMKVR